MRHTPIKGGKQSGKEADKEIGQQNIHGKRRVLRLGNTVLGKTATGEGFGEGELSNIHIEDKKDGENLFWSIRCWPLSQ